MMAKKFFFVCAGILMLVGAYSLGARNVEAQVGGDVVGVSSFVTTSGSYIVVAITNTGDFYRSENAGEDWYYRTNIFGGAVSSEQPTLDDLKSQFK